MGSCRRRARSKNGSRDKVRGSRGRDNIGRPRFDALVNYDRDAGGEFVDGAFADRDDAVRLAFGDVSIARVDASVKSVGLALEATLIRAVLLRGAMVAASCALE